VRFLGAIIPRVDRTWFLKLMGPEEKVQAHKEAFDRFLASVRFTGKDDPPLTWKVPEGWSQEKGGSELRYATFRLGPKEDSLELTVTRLGREGQAGDILANVNRWRQQIGLAPVDEKELAKITRELDLGNAVATLVDMTGMAAASAGKTPPFAPGGGSPKKEAAPELDYQVPEGWKKAAGTQFALVAFQVEEGRQKATVTVTPAGGSLLANINRWRDQLGLDPIREEQLRKETEDVSMPDGTARFVDLVGKDAPPERDRILGAILDHGGVSWFFKMTGPRELLERHKPAFLRFLKSVRFKAN
jgi:hypothetical protein